MLQLIKRCPEYTVGYKAYCQKYYDHNIVFFRPSNPKYLVGDWLLSTKDWYDRKEKGLVEGRPVSFHYWAVDSGRFIGEFQLRTGFPPKVMLDIGSVGYAVRVSERNKGYGTQILCRGLEIAKEYGMEKVLLNINEQSRRQSFCQTILDQSLKSLTLYVYMVLESRGIQMDYKSENLVLHFVTEDDLAEVARTWPADHHPLSDTEAREAIAYMRGNYGRNTKGCIRHLCLAVYEKDHPGTIMGWCGLDGTRNHSEPEIFILLDEAYRNQGYGTQCVKELLRIAAEDYALPGVHGGCAKENIASARAMEKGGMVQYDTEENGDPLFRFCVKL